MIITSFSINDKDKGSWFFEKIFLFADIGMDVIFKMFFFTSSNIEIDFNDRKLR